MLYLYSSIHNDPKALKSCLDIFEDPA